MAHLSLQQPEISLSFVRIERDVSEDMGGGIMIRFERARNCNVLNNFQMFCFTFRNQRGDISNDEDK